MRKTVRNSLVALAVLLLSLGIPSTLEAELPLRLAGVEAPATEGDAYAYPGKVAVRSFVQGYVVAVEGEWGSATLLIHTDGVAEPLAESVARGKVLVSPGEFVAVLPSAGQLVRWSVPPAGGEAPVATQSIPLERLHARYGTSDLLESSGLYVVTYAPALAGLRAGELLVVEDLEAAVAAVLEPPVLGDDLAAITGNHFDPTPPDDGGGGCSTSCSVTCPLGGNSCSATSGGGTLVCCSCTCSGSTASCRCR